MFYVGKEPVLNDHGEFHSYLGPAGYVSGVQMGDQIWMVNNLNIHNYRDGTPIPFYELDDFLALDPANGDADGGYTVGYDDRGLGTDLTRSSWEHIYGKLYNCMAVYNSAGLAPEGWRIPTYADLTELKDFILADNSAATWTAWNGVQNNLGIFLKEAGWSHWDVLNQATTGRSGTYGMNLQGSNWAWGDPGGYNLPHGTAFYCHVDGGDGSSLPHALLAASNLTYGDGISLFDVNTSFAETIGMSVRCVRDL